MIQKLKSPKEKELEYKKWLESLPEDERKKNEEDDKLIEERDRQRIADEEEYERKEKEFSKIIIRNAVEQNICGEYSSDLELPEEAQILLPYSFYSCRNIQAAYVHENIRVCTKESFYETDDILLTNAAYKKENGLMINTHLGILLYADNDLEDVIVPEGVVEIAPYAFSGCNMKSIKLPESLEMIGEYCFIKCKYLQQITIPSKIKKIAKGTLCNCASLREVILQEGLEIIEECSFIENKELKKCQFPKTLKEIGFRAFFNCEKLEDVNYTPSIKLADEAFANCKSRIKV